MITRETRSQCKQFYCYSYYELCVMPVLYPTYLGSIDITYRQERLWVLRSSGKQR
jgi:hypothetical protein